MNAWKWRMRVFTIAIIIVLSYYNSIENSFAFDDHLAIVNNNDVKSTTSWIDLWSHDIWGKGLQSIDSHRSYRPLLICVFKLIVHTCGFQAQIFRMVSVALHFVVSVLVYQVSLKLFKNDIIAFGCSLLFSSHPIHVESVSAVVNMAEALSAIFYLIAYDIFLSSTNSSYDFLVWAICIIASVLFKETGVTIAGMVVSRCLIDLFVAVNKAHFMKQIEEWAKTSTHWILASFMTIGCYVTFRLFLIKVGLIRLVGAIVRLDISFIVNSFSKSYLGDSQLIRKAENPFAFLVGQEKGLSLMYLHFRYLYVLIWPAQQCAEYAFDCIPKVSDLGDIRNLYSLMAYSAVLLTGIFGLVQACKPPRLHTDVFAPRSTLLLGRIQPSELPFWSCDRRGVLSALSWLVVPFIPLAGVLLRLGTLLAERLLYIPSIGFCMLLAVAIHNLSYGLYVLTCFIFGDNASDSDAEPEDSEADDDNELAAQVLTQNKRSSEIRRFATRISKIFYWAVLLLIVAAYARRTHVYNKVWKDDETLFIESLKVCPRSSKLNLQVAKLYLNRGEYPVAKVYVEAAKKIDPDFCDVGYQEALLKLFYEQDAEGAMAAAADNLQCIFTNMQSLELLTKMWERETEERPKDHKLLEKHGDYLIRGGLVSLGVKKYQAACVLAFEGKAYNKAVELSLKAEKAMPHAIEEAGLQVWQQRRLDSPNDLISMRRDVSNYLRADLQGRDGNPTFESHALRDLACYVDMLSGTVRQHLLDLKKKKSFKPSKKTAEELQRAKQLLFRAIQPDCVIVDFVSRKVLSNQAVVAVNHLSSLLSAVFNKHAGANPVESKLNVSLVEEYGYFAETVTQVFTTMYTFSSPLDSTQNASELSSDSSSTAVVSGLANTAPDEVKMRAVELAVTSTQMWEIAGRLNFKRENFSRAAACFAKALKWGLRNMVGAVGGSCSSLFWRAHSLAGDDGFLDNTTAVKEVIQLLTAVSDCEDGVTGRSHDIMLTRAVEERKKLEAFLTNITN